MPAARALAYPVFFVIPCQTLFFLSASFQPTGLASSFNKGKAPGHSVGKRNEQWKRRVVFQGTDLFVWVLFKSHVIWSQNYHVCYDNK